MNQGKTIYKPNEGTSYNTHVANCVHVRIDVPLRLNVLSKDIPLPGPGP